MLADVQVLQSEAHSTIAAGDRKHSQAHLLNIIMYITRCTRGVLVFVQSTPHIVLCRVAPVGREPVTSRSQVS